MCKEDGKMFNRDTIKFYLLNCTTLQFGEGHLNLEAIVDDIVKDLEKIPRLYINLLQYADIEE